MKIPNRCWSRYRSTRPCPSNYIATLNNSDKEAKAISAKSNVVACYFSLPRIASPSRTAGPRVPVSERKRCALRALMLSATRRRRKTGFLRRKRRFDVVSHTRLAPYFKLPPNTLLEAFSFVVLVMWFLWDWWWAFVIVLQCYIKIGSKF